MELEGITEQTPITIQVQRPDAVAGKKAIPPPEKKIISQAIKKEDKPKAKAPTIKKETRGRKPLPLSERSHSKHIYLKADTIEKAQMIANKYGQSFSALCEGLLRSQIVKEGL